jgi:hypothetical protein
MTPPSSLTKSQPCAYVEDTSLLEVTSLIQEAISNTTITKNQPMSQDSSFIDPPSHTKLWINIIRHRHARNTELSTLQLFRSSTSKIKQIDPNLTIPPIDSTKQNFTSLTTSKQIEKLSTNQLHLYFKSWFNEQHYSLSGFIHLGTILSFDELCQHPNIQEWLSTFQYSLQMCKSQDEEMSLMAPYVMGVFSSIMKTYYYVFWSIPL